MNYRLAIGAFALVAQGAVMAIEHSGVPAPSIGMRGTALVVATTGDGILVASDSRFAVSDENNQARVLATIDGFQKIYQVGPHVLAAAGQVVFAPKLLGAVIDEYVERGVAEHPQDAVAGLITHSATSLGPPQARVFKGNTLVIAGFVQGTPTACAYDGRPTFGNGNIQCATAPPILIEFNTVESYFQKLRHKVHRMKAEMVADTATEAIASFGAINENKFKVGGSVQIALLSQHGFRWLRNEPAKAWRNTSEIVADYDAGRLKYSLVPPATEKDLRRVVAATTR